MKLIRIFAAALALLVGIAPAAAQVTNQTSDYTPSGGPVAASASPGSIPGYVDTTGNRWQITSGNALQMVNSDNGLNQGALVRPAGETQINGRVRIRFQYLSTYATVGSWLRFLGAAGATQGGYLVYWDQNANKFSFYSMVSGTIAGPFAQSTAATLTNGSTYVLDSQVVQTNSSTTTITATMYASDGTTVVVPTFSATDTTASLQNVAGRTGIWENGSLSVPGDFPLITRITTYNDSAGSAATSFTLTGPGSGTVGSASSVFTLTPNGTTTATATPSDGGAGGSFSPSSFALAGATAKTFTYTPASAGTKTITVAAAGLTSSPSSLSYAAGTGPVTIARNNAALYYSPGTWADNGSARMANSVGSYVKFKFTGTSIAMSTTALTSMGAYPQVRAIVDGFAYNVGLSTGTSYTIASGLASGTHTIELYYRASLYSAGSWWDYTNALKLTGFVLDSGATVTAPDLRTNKLLAFGDSLTQGYFLDGTSSPANDDAMGNYVGPMAEALDAEYGQVGYGGQSYEANTAVSGVPKFNTSYALFAQGYSRLTSGQFTTQPTYITVMLGTNGAPAQSDVATAITNLRTAAPNAWLFMIVPGSGTGRTQIAAAVSAANDNKVKLIDAGTRYQTGLWWANSSGAGTPTEAAPADGIHYGRRTNARLAAEWTRQIQHALEPRRFNVTVH